MPGSALGEGVWQVCSVRGAERQPGQHMAVVLGTSAGRPPSVAFTLRVLVTRRPRATLVPPLPRWRGPVVRPLTASHTKTRVRAGTASWFSPDPRALAQGCSGHS